MITHFMPALIGCKAEWARMKVKDAHARGIQIMVGLGGRAFVIPKDYALEMALPTAITLRTPDGMLVTYKPRKAPR